MKQIFSRLVWTLPVVWLVVSLVFLLIHLVPGDPIQAILGDSQIGRVQFDAHETAL